MIKRLSIAASLGAALLTTGAARAEYPEKPIEMIVAFAPGGGTDVAARSIARYMEKYLGGNARIGVINKGELVLVEDKATLMRKLGKKQLTLTLQAPLERIPDDLAEYPLELAEDGHSLVYTFDVQAQETGIAALLRRLTQHGIDFKDLHSSESSLEDIFVSLVRQNREARA